MPLKTQGTFKAVPLPVCHLACVQRLWWLYNEKCAGEKMDIFGFFHLYTKLLKSWWLSCLRNPHKRQFPTCFPMFHIVFPQFLQAFPMSPLVSLPVFLILGLTHFLLILHACSEWPYSWIFKNITEKDQPKTLSGMCYTFNLVNNTSSLQ